MPRSDYGDRLAGYTEVKDRIGLFYEKYPDGRLVTDNVMVTDEPDGTPRVWVYAKAYRTPDDPLPGVGSSWMVLPGSTPYTKGSELENTETSAWGRAIGSLGIGIGAGFASKDEIEAKSGEESRIPAPDKTDDGGLIGRVEKGNAKDSDLELRETPDGWAIGFRLKGNGRGGIKVVAHNALAQAIAAWSGQIVGQRVICWGFIKDESFRPKGSKSDVTYQVMNLERIQTPDFTLPAPDRADEPPGQPADASEAESYPLPLDPEERAMIAGDLAE